MKFITAEPSVELYKEGFEEPDLLERKNVGDALSSILNRIDDPLVVALNGKWGTGKTYFLKRWVGEHIKRDNSITVYFDAFAHDYLSDPLPALVSALAERLPFEHEDKIRLIKQSANILIKPVTRMSLALATSGLTEVFGAVAGTVGNEVKDHINRLWDGKDARQTAMLEFRDAIISLAKPMDNFGKGSTIIFVVDELDRCRPNYALEVLEVIKHFFTVPHIHFVLGVNLQALESSVHAIYGDNIDAHAYLQKFIQLTLELPSDLRIEHEQRSTISVYLKHLLNDMEIPNHIAKELRIQVNHISLLNNISLRDIGKIVSSVSLVSDEVINNDKYLNGWIYVMNDLIISKIVCPDLYPKFLNAAITQSDLESYLGLSEDDIQTYSIEGYQSEEHTKLMHYYIWLYIAQDGNTSGFIPDYRNISIHFHDRGPYFNVKDIPMTIHRKWLDRFS